MNFKIVLTIIFLIASVIFIFASYQVSSKTDDEIIEITASDSQDDLLNMNTQETYRLTMKNALPEVKALGGLLLLLFIIMLGLKYWHRK